MNLVCPFFGNRSGTLDICILCALVAARQQHDHQRDAPYKIQPVTRSMVNPQFDDAISYRLDAARISVS